MKYVPALLFIVPLLVACSSSYGIRKARAYVQERTAGTIPVDDNGRPLRSGVSEEHLLFVETDSSGPMPTFSTVWIAQKAYTAQPVEMKPPYPSLGKTATGETVLLSSKPGHKLWQLVLTPDDAANAASASVREKINQKNIVITGMWQGKNFTYGFDKEERLAPLHFQ